MQGGKKKPTNKFHESKRQHSPKNADHGGEEDEEEKEAEEEEQLSSELLGGAPWVEPPPLMS